MIGQNPPDHNHQKGLPQKMASKNEELRQRNKDAAQRAALFWIELANKRQSEIVHELLAVSAVLIPLSASIVIAKISLSVFQQHLLVIIWILLLLSVAAGFIQIAIDSNFFIALSRDASSREKLWSDTQRSVNDIENDVKKLGETPGSSTMIPVYIQAVTFLLALITITIVGISIIPNTRNTSLHFQKPSLIHVSSNRNRLYLKNVNVMRAK